MFFVMDTHAKALADEGFKVIGNSVFAAVSKEPAFCTFRGCQVRIRAGELHIVRCTKMGNRWVRDAMHLECGVRRCWLRRERAMNAMESAGGLGSRINEMRERAGLNPLPA